MGCKYKTFSWYLNGFADGSSNGSTLQYRGETLRYAVVHARTPDKIKNKTVVVCVCVFSSHSFWTSSSLDIPAGVTQEEGHTGFLIHLLSAVRAFIFLAKRIQPFLSLVNREVEFCINRSPPVEHFSFSFYFF